MLAVQLTLLFAEMKGSSGLCPVQQTGFQGGNIREPDSKPEKS